MPEPLKLRDVEATFQMPCSLTGEEVEVVDDGKTFIYRGRAYNLHLSHGLFIQGAVSLEKVEKRTKIRKVKISGFFLGQYKEEPVMFEERLWLIGTEEEYGGGNCEVFVNNVGKSATSREWGYRNTLVGKLATNKILVSDALLNAVFGLIDQKLLEVYHTVINFGGFPKS